MLCSASVVSRSLIPGSLRTPNSELRTPNSDLPKKGSGHRKTPQIAAFLNSSRAIRRPDGGAKIAGCDNLPEEAAISHIIENLLY
jgi:hypothetical protein